MKNINTVQYWNKKYTDEYDSSRTFRFPRRMYHNIIIENIGNKGKLIDVGCGNGLFIDDVARNRQGLELYGVDFSDECIKKNIERTKGSSIKFHKSDLYGCDRIFNFEFNYVVAMEVVEHMTDYKDTFAQLNKLCKEGGKVFITIPNKYAIRSEEHVHYFSSGEMHEIIKQFGTIILYKKIPSRINGPIRNLLFCYKPFKGVVL